MVTPAPSGMEIGVAGLTHEFALGGGRLRVLEDVTLTVQPGAFVALVGPSGSGKSTLLRLLAGLERPTSGRLTAGGVPLSGPDPGRALVFQDPTLFPWRTVRRNVEIGPQSRGLLRERHEEVTGVLELVGLTDFADAYPSQLSGGMAQRAALARALVNRPEVLLLDEPLGALDALTRLSMQRELVRLWRDRRFTAVLVTHDVDEALRLADRVVVLSARPGRVLADLPVAAPRPRDTDAAELRELRRHVLRLLGQER
ncbi:ABC transporter ATP-binding protein [Sphaerisporangium krabiense]|uniref:NitT/TauT family transport system ATP-binding protein n=1 Tax=Sphaerisporangium krabiense TaxID=763782 RepID=A0A7W9DSD0_9ACTN|nr:ABC transporter ATP-binding protein [Sphaerisporangium krabiense]MBB5629572.1 NitT/TauT family transport system ATP-binding protein [Sphaerisporangium krabiense]GII67229.1 ABC transporter ATP-binding protein [Sphaerisporangium krabiense]